MCFCEFMLSMGHSANLSSLIRPLQRLCVQITMTLLRLLCSCFMSRWQHFIPIGPAPADTSAGSRLEKQGYPIEVIGAEIRLNRFICLLDVRFLFSHSSSFFGRTIILCDAQITSVIMNYRDGSIRACRATCAFF